MDKPMSYYAFEVLYWCGVRMGELLALTPQAFGFERSTLTISKSYQRLKGKDVITEPKNGQESSHHQDSPLPFGRDTGLSEITVRRPPDRPNLPRHQVLPSP